MVDWSLARQLARFAAGAGSTPPSLGEVCGVMRDEFGEYSEA